jgi:ubiquinone/menaquinone biosynthesis C-methylase UbiE
MLKIIKKMVAENGIVWSMHVIPYFLIRKLIYDYQIPFLDRRIKRIEQKRRLSGINSRELNTLIWNSWDWEKSAGEEWTKSPGWKQALIDDVMMKYFTKGKTVLEIGPGAGKWTESLQQASRKLILVDISKKCIEMCKKRFSQCSNISYYVNDGFNLSFLADNSINFIWSFDVFVHIAPADVENYFSEFARILKSTGRGIIHHAAEGGLHGGWRSSVTSQMIHGFLKKNNLKLIAQFDTWGDGDKYDVKLYRDAITVFEKN